MMKTTQVPIGENPCRALCAQSLSVSMTGLLVLLGLLVGVAGSYVSVRQSV